MTISGDMFERSNTRKWTDWVRCTYRPNISAPDFLHLWKQTLGALHALYGNEIPSETCQVIQFIEAVNTHPDMDLWDPVPRILEDDASNMMERVYDDFLSYAHCLPARKLVVVFLARSSSGSRDKQDAWLRDSLGHTKSAHERHYGPLQCLESDCRYYTFVHGSNEPFARSGETIAYFVNLRSELEKCDGQLLLVTNGWDGLTTDRHSFVKLFSEWSERITFRVYAEEDLEKPRKFFQVNTTQVCQVFNGDIDFDLNRPDHEASLEDSTALFIRMFRTISAVKESLSKDSVGLRTLTHRRNYPPEFRELAKYICTVCQVPCATSYDLNRHMNHKHKEYDDPEANLVCHYCNARFKRKDHRDRHMKEACKQRPSQGGLSGNESSQPQKKRSTRGTKIRVPLPLDQPAGSDNGLLSYRQLTAEHAKHLPRLEIDIAKLGGLDEDIIYKGELYCRFPGCSSRHRHSEPTNLRTHYQRIHKLTYQTSSPGILNPSDKKKHDQGLEWLARWVQLGKEHAGDKPLQLRK